MKINYVEQQEEDATPGRELELTASTVDKVGNKAFEVPLETSGPSLQKAHRASSITPSLNRPLGTLDTDPSLKKILGVSSSMKNVLGTVPSRKGSTLRFQLSEDIKTGSLASLHAGLPELSNKAAAFEI